MQRPSAAPATVHPDVTTAILPRPMAGLPLSGRLRTLHILPVHPCPGGAVPNPMSSLPGHHLSVRGQRWHGFDARRRRCGGRDDDGRGLCGCNCGRAGNCQSGDGTRARSNKVLTMHETLLYQDIMAVHSNHRPVTCRHVSRASQMRCRFRPNDTASHHKLLMVEAARR
jgi:hypothetical protein